MTFAILKMKNETIEVNKFSFCKTLIGFSWHEWFYLPPTLEQLEEIRLLISQGNAGLEDINQIAHRFRDKLCVKCFKTEIRMLRLIEALKEIREKK